MRSTVDCGSKLQGTALLHIARSKDQMVSFPALHSFCYFPFDRKVSEGDDHARRSPKDEMPKPRTTKLYSITIEAI